MKKILVFLLLITGLVKAQVVVPKSTTTFSNINAVGSVTVGGNLRVSGSETVTGNAVINKVRVGSTTAPSATLDVTGTMSVSSTATLASTLKLGSSAVLTGGNTGTIAVLSDAVFPVMFNAQSTSLTDGNTYYCNTINRGLSTSASTGLLYLPYNVTLVGYSMNFFTTGTLGSAENMTVSVSGTASDVVLLSNVTVTTAISTYTASGLNQDFNAGTGIETKINCPTWATNPTNVHVATTYWFVRRQ